MQLSFYQTMGLFKADINRRLALEGKVCNGFNRFLIFYKRGLVSVFIYRIKHYLYLKNLKPLKLLIWLLRYPEFHYCHNEIDPRAEIGSGLVVSDFGGLALGGVNIIGKNCTFMGKATPTLGAMEGINFLVDKIRIGNYCVIGHNVKIINPITIADGVQIKPNSVLIRSIATAGSVVSGFPAITTAVVPLVTVMAWSPLLSQFVKDIEVSTEFSNQMGTTR